MKKYILIKADINDGDFVTEVTGITEENLIRIKEILNKMPKSGKSIRYETQELGGDDTEDTGYDYITIEEKKFLAKYLPNGDPNYSGIYTIEDIVIFEFSEKLL